MRGRVRIVRSRIVCLLKKTPGILGCIVLFISTMSPFLFPPFPSRWPITTQMIMAQPSIEGWTFKIVVQFHYADGSYLTHDYWFNSYQFSEFVPPELSWLLIMILTTQILALVTGVASVLINKKVIRFAPVILCSTVTALMTYFNVTLRFQSKIGYSVTFLSILLFLTAIIVELVSSRRRKRIQDTSSGITDTKYVLFD